MESKVIKNLSNLKQKKPLIQCISNFVTTNFNANALLAIGASPIMSYEHKEIEDILSISNSLAINIGNIDSYWLESMLIASKTAKQTNKPWILDPVGAGASKYRDESLKKLLKFTPTVIKGNSSEILSLDQKLIKSKGVDSSNTPEQAIDSAVNLSRKYNNIICISGENDYVISGDKILKIENGHPMMEKVTGTGCTATVIIAAFASITDNYFEATATGMIIMSLAAELAAERTLSPGSFYVEFLNALYEVDDKIIKSKLKISYL